MVSVSESVILYNGRIHKKVIKHFPDEVHFLSWINDYLKIFQRDRETKDNLSCVQMSR